RSPQMKHSLLEPHSLNKNLLRPPPDMAISGKICFRNRCFGIEQTSHSLDQIEIEINDSPGLKPFLNDAPLQSPRLPAEVGYVQLLRYGLFWIDRSIEPFCFIRGD